MSLTVPPVPPLSADDPTVAELPYYYSLSYLPRWSLYAVAARTAMYWGRPAEDVQHPLPEKWARFLAAASFESHAAHRFDSSSNAWVPLSDSDTRVLPPLAPVDAAASSHTVRVACYNVLSDGEMSAWLDWVVPSSVRFRWQLVHLLPSLNADVIALEEVNGVYLELLLAQTWVREHYYVSSVDVARYARDARSNIILSRFPLRDNCMIAAPLRVSAARLEIPSASATQPPLSLALCVVHLTAQAENVATRRAQLQFLYPALASRWPTAARLMVGDWNLHSENENELIQAPYVDVWTQLRGSDPGITWDGQNNPLIAARMPGDIRRMRLDRVALDTSGEPLRRPTPVGIGIFAQEAIIAPPSPMSFMRGSDHYGLVFELSLAASASGPAAAAAAL